MSRIDQALSKLNTPGRSAAEDGTLDDPWDLASPSAASEPVPAPAEAAPEALAWSRAEPAPPAPVDDPAQSPSSLGDVVPVTRRLSEKVIGGPLPLHVVEEYRRLGAIVHHMQVERGVRVVMVTSAVAGEGKTLTATNLALTLSASYGRNVLLIDADLRRPTLHHVFDTVSVTGLGDLLRGDGPIPPLVQVTPRLALLAAGRPDADPLTGLTSDRMRALLAEAKETFDFVIIDTPPIGLLTDANLLAAMVDVAFLVVRAASTPYELVRRAADAIGRHRIAGVVLNQASPQKHTHGYADYYGEYRAPRQG